MDRSHIDHLALSKVHEEARGHSDWKHIDERYLEGRRRHVLEEFLVCSDCVAWTMLSIGGWIWLNQGIRCISLAGLLLLDAYSNYLNLGSGANPANLWLQVPQMAARITTISGVHAFRLGSSQLFHRPTVQPEGYAWSTPAVSESFRARSDCRAATRTFYCSELQGQRIPAMEFTSASALSQCCPLLCKIQVALGRLLLLQQGFRCTTTCPEVQQVA